MLKRRIEPLMTQRPLMKEDLDSYLSYLCSSVKSMVEKYWREELNHWCTEATDERGSRFLSFLSVLICEICGWKILKRRIEPLMHRGHWWKRIWILAFLICAHLWNLWLKNTEEKNWTTDDTEATDGRWSRFLSFLSVLIREICGWKILKRRIEPLMTQRPLMEDDLDSYLSYLCSSVKSVVKKC
jgi:uncharacterized membrane protein